MPDLEKDSVERTLAIPLWCRAIAVKKLPQLMPDYDAVRILEEMGEKNPPNVFYNMQCAAFTGAVRQYDFACETRDYLKTHPQATIVELGPGLSCLRRQMEIEDNHWVNVDFPDVIKCREKYIPTGEHEKNVACDITDHTWFDEIPFKEEKGVVFLAAGVLHYLTDEAVKNLLRDMAERFPGGLFIFDFVSKKGLSSGNVQVRATDNSTKLTFSMENAEKEIPIFSDRIKNVQQKSYLEGYQVFGVKYNLITKAFIKSKKNKYFVAHVEFAK